MKKVIDVKNFILVSYIILPSIFYFIPYVVSYESGFLRMYFFNTFDIPHNVFARFFWGYLILGFLVYKTLKVTDFKIICEEQTSVSLNVFIIVFYLAFMYTSISYLKLLLTPLFYVFISSYRPKALTFLVLLCLSSINMVVFYDRYPVILILMIWMLPFLSRLSVFKLLLSAVIGVFILVFLLQPLRAGLMPFSSGFGELSYLIKHLFPIYIGAYLLLIEDFSFSQLLSEAVPFMKGALGYESVIEIIAREGLPKDIIDMGIRHGSNSSMYFDGWGPLVLIGLLVTLNLSLRFLRLQKLRNAILLMFVLQGPYFIRRTFGSLYIDILVVIFVSVILLLYIQVFNSNSSRRNYF
ncbi:hypothetical protein NDJ06_14840 [Vibrio alginolyticus]|uniref:hypothetical protein n=1 Tax=Vibrio TaxID=662 RepID=UPI00215FE36F|nr:MULTISPECIES: hypothetical protein [Vibrio]EGQ8156986.1 hypothetical protein [Vibrio alginolyticus]ELB2794558.1 hypothetical protein [Vibrio alginolyticus]MCS0186568.1 hypothetical protein [Vibrio alginolyticus]MDW1538483.1 hypothetical protein [Vibrio sp. YT-17]MDW1954418.1 hypothetical protein [Vibrio sp. Vb0562]